MIYGKEHNTIKEDTITDISNIGVPRYLGYFHAGIYRSVLMYGAEDPLAECAWQLWAWEYDHGEGALATMDKHTH